MRKCRRRRWKRRFQRSTQRAMSLPPGWVHLAGTLRTACAGEPSAKVIQISLDHLVHGGWSMDYQGLPPVDCFIAAEPDATVPALLDAIGPRKEKLADQTRSESSPSTPPM